MSLTGARKTRRPGDASINIKWRAFSRQSLLSCHYVAYIQYCFFISSTSSVPLEAEQGEALLWSSWLEKHPESELLSTEDQGTVTAPWDNPETKAMWDEHAADSYTSYWEQYSYWAGQGWTTDQSICNGNTGGEAMAGVLDTGLKIHSVEWKDRQTGDESQRREEVKALQDDVEVLKDLLGQKCTLDTNESSVTDSEIHRDCMNVADIREQSEDQLCGSDDPSDGGNQRKRPAASSQQNTAKQTGNSACIT